MLKPDLIRVLFLRDGAPQQRRTWMVPAHDTPDVPWTGRDRRDETSWPIPAHRVEHAENGVVLSTDAMCVEIALARFALTWSRPDGAVFARDRATHAYMFGRDEIRHAMARETSDVYHGLGDKTGSLDLHGRRLRTTMMDSLGVDPERGDPHGGQKPVLRHAEQKARRGQHIGGKIAQHGNRRPKDQQAAQRRRHPRHSVGQRGLGGLQRLAEQVLGRELDQDVEHGDSGERAEDAKGNVALGPFDLARHTHGRLHAHEGEDAEDHRLADRRVLRHRQRLGGRPAVQPAYDHEDEQRHELDQDGDGVQPAARLHPAHVDPGQGGEQH